MPFHVIPHLRTPCVLARVGSMGAILASAGLCAPSLAAEPAAVVTPVFSADVNSAGQPIVFPPTDGHVAVSMFEIAPGASLPVHMHPFPRMGYVLSGTLQVVNEESGAKQTFKTGEFILESVGLWHQGSNPGTESLRLLVIDLTEKGHDNTVLR